MTRVSMATSIHQVPNILIVDDRQENRFALNATLNQINATVIQADSGSKALQCLLDHDIALVLLDVKMPDMDGYEVANIMRKTQATATIPIVFLTAVNHDLIHIEKAYLSGAVDFLFKPLNTDILLAKVQIFLNLWSQNNVLTELANKYEAALEKITIQNEELKKLAFKDHLTGLFQRRVFDNILLKEVSRSIRHQSFLSIAMLDLDHFKLVNDDFGHAVGDTVLISISHILLALMREADLVCRFGGEEFVILMPNTQLSDAQLIAERIRLAVENEIFSTEKNDLKVTISIGIAEFHSAHEKTPEELLKKADDCLYQAKHNGRNQVFPNPYISQ